MSIPKEDKYVVFAKNLLAVFLILKEKRDLFHRVRVSIRPNGWCNLGIFIKLCISIMRLEATLLSYVYISYYQ
jgi:hypothetical protein